MAKYWYDASSSRSRVNKLKENYEDIVQKVMAVAKTMENYVCVDGKWYDDNARVVAQWWNQSKAGSKSGKLQWTGEKLEIVNPNEGKNDGEDRIKRVANCASNVVCVSFWTLQSLIDSHHEINIDFKKEIGVWQKNRDAWTTKGVNNNIYNYSTNNFSSTLINEQRKMLEEIGYKKWTTTTLNTASSNGKKSDTEQMNQFITQIDKKLDNLEKSWIAFATCAKNTANNDDQSKWWGFDPRTRNKLVRLIKELDERIETDISSFRSNLYTALSNTLDSKNLNLNKLKG